MQQVSEHVYKCEYTLAAHSVAFKSTVFDRFLDKLIDINIASINYCREKLGINVPMVLSSTLNITTTKSERLADICRHFGATEYISGGGGKAYLDESVFDCTISYFHPDVPNYYTTLQHI